ncbi:MAG TPA: CatB-related O-acetyltransferase [Micromonosporaceae bacterium]|nr:CatB-related O-acetyltransferase [Micromonosporaceae bacterium]
MSGGNHPMLGVGTYPFGMFGGDWATQTRDVLAGLPSRGDTVVGNNVWLGMGTIVMPGIRIGDGAIVAAGSVVTSDVPPYAIAGGNPAREIRRRYTDDEVAELQRIAWWNWPVDLVTAHARTILTGDVAALRAVAEASGLA